MGPDRVRVATRSAIVKALELLANNPWPIPREEIQVEPPEEAGPHRSLAFITEGLFAGTPYGPWFKRDDSGGLVSPHEPFFGFYALAAACRGLLVGVRFIEAGDMLKEKGFLAAALLDYYTAAYQLLTSFISLHGRVPVDHVEGAPKLIVRPSSVGVERDETALPQAVTAVLTPSNRWNFQGRRRWSHGERWGELRQVFRDPAQLPDFYVDCFEYLSSYGPYSASKDPRDLFDAGLRMLAEARHEAMYGGVAYDFFVYDLLAEGEIHHDAGLDAKASAVRGVAIGEMEASVAELSGIATATAHLPRGPIESLQFVVGGRRPIEVGPPSVRGVSQETAEQLDRLYWWLMPPSPPEG